MYKLVTNICSIVLAAEARSTLTLTMTVWHAFARRLSLGAHNLHNRCPWHGGLLAQCIPLSGCLSSDLAYRDISGILGGGPSHNSPLSFFTLASDIAPCRSDLHLLGFASGLSGLGAPPRLASWRGNRPLVPGFSSDVGVLWLLACVLVP